MIFFFSSSFNSLRRNWAVLAYILHTLTHTKWHMDMHWRGAHAFNIWTEWHTHRRAKVKNKRICCAHHYKRADGFDSETCAYGVPGVREGRHIGRLKWVRTLVWVCYTVSSQPIKYETETSYCVSSSARQGCHFVSAALFRCHVYSSTAWLAAGGDAAVFTCDCCMRDFNMWPGSNRKSATQFIRFCLTADLLQFSNILLYFSYM